MLMGAGVTYNQFEELSKRAFVEQALGAPDPRGRRVNTSRIAVRTGLSRKEVARVRAHIESPIEGIETTFQVGRPARALQLWYSEPRFLDENGKPVDLAYDGGKPSFVDLVRLVGGDVPAGAVRAELLAAGGIRELPNGMLRPCKRFFVPAGLDEDLVVGFAFLVAPMLETLRHNVEHPADAFIQRVSYSDRLPIAELAAFRDAGNAQSSQLMHSVDDWLACREDSPGIASDADRRVGIGVFYFETERVRSE
jgi:hypothetical protein